VLRKNLKDVTDKKAEDRLKYERLKVKYGNVQDRAKSAGVTDIPDFDENSQGFSNTQSFLGLVAPQKPKPVQISSVPSSSSSQMMIELKPTNFKKPSFSSASMIGGFRKKDDKVKANY
jgi:hypothetical protein